MATGVSSGLPSSTSPMAKMFGTFVYPNDKEKKRQENRKKRKKKEKKIERKEKKKRK